MHTLIGMHMHSKAAGQITFGEHCVCVCVVVVAANTMK